MEYKGHTSLKEAPISKFNGEKGIVRVGCQVLWKNTTLADPKHHKPLERLREKYGSELFGVKEILETPTKQVVLKIDTVIDSGLINIMYFTLVG
jgi:hypothetical protein